MNETIKAKLVKFARGAAIAAAGAVLAYLSGTVIPDLEVSGTGATVVALLSMGVNGLKLVLSKLDADGSR